MPPEPDPFAFQQAPVVPKFHNHILSFEVGLASYLKGFLLSVPLCICLSIFYSESGDNVHLSFIKSVFVFNYQHFKKYFISFLFKHFLKLLSLL